LKRYKSGEKQLLDHNWTMKIAAINFKGRGRPRFQLSMLNRLASIRRPNLGRVPRVVVFDLKSKKLMNCFQRVGIRRLNTHSAACGQLFEAVKNLRAFVFHLGTPGGGWSWTNMGIENSPLENIVTMCVRCDRITYSTKSALMSPSKTNGSTTPARLIAIRP